MTEKTINRNTNRRMLPVPATPIAICNTQLETPRATMTQHKAQMPFQASSFIHDERNCLEDSIYISFIADKDIEQRTLSWGYHFLADTLTYHQTFFCLNNTEFMTAKTISNRSRRHSKTPARLQKLVNLVFGGTRNNDRNLVFRKNHIRRRIDNLNSCRK